MNYKIIDELTKQVGGPLRLTSLIVNRARQLIKRAPVLIETKINDPVQIAFLELMQNKIKLSDEAEQLPKTAESGKLLESVEKSS